MIVEKDFVQTIVTIMEFVPLKEYVLVKEHGKE
jgi:hypothetical protein